MPKEFKINEDQAIIDYGVKGPKGDIGDPQGPKGHIGYLKFYGIKGYIKNCIIERFKNK